jgi:Ni,Fe-hydrogenase III large subunit/Ni,Fe-hydrogenase III component G
MTTAELQRDLKACFGEKLSRLEERVPGKLSLRVQPEALRALAQYLFAEIGCRFVVSAGLDRRAFSGDFAVVHFFALDPDRIAIEVSVSLPPESPHLDSISPVVPAANWAEREFAELVGITPLGHPDPRKLVLADDWPPGLYPLRRDVPHDIRPDPAQGAAFRPKEPPEGATVVPIGPFFPVLKEPAYFRLFVKGEEVVGCDYRGFYVHRGIEKLGDSVLTYNQVPFLAERICGICGYVHSVCYCEAMEEAAGIPVPPRARYIRSIMLELERIHSHLLWLGIAGHIIGFDTILMQAWRIREPVMWLCELISGSRKNYGMNLVGGVRRDIPPELHPKIKEVLTGVEQEAIAVINAVVGDTPLLMRLKGVGPLSRDDAIRLCVVGPTARGSGVDVDGRRDHPYAAYSELDFKVIVKEEGDALARTLVRLEELLESIALVRRALKQMPRGEFMARVDGEIPRGLEGTCFVEAPRGEDFHYVLTGEGNRPYRWKVRAPSYPNLQAIPTMIQGQMVADMPITLGSIDPCFSCTERLETVDVRTGAVRVFSQDELLRMAREGRRCR